MRLVTPACQGIGPSECAWADPPLGQHECSTEPLWHWLLEEKQKQWAQVQQAQVHDMREAKRDGMFC